MAGQSANTSQHQQLDAAAPEFYPEGVVEGSDQVEDLPRAMVTPTLDWPHATNKGDVSRPMPVAGVMQKQGIPALDQVYTHSNQENSKHFVRSTDTVDPSNCQDTDGALTMKAHT